LQFYIYVLLCTVFVFVCNLALIIKGYYFVVFIVRFNNILPRLSKTAALSAWTPESSIPEIALPICS